MEPQQNQPQNQPNTATQPDAAWVPPRPIQPVQLPQTSPAPVPLDAANVLPRPKSRRTLRKIVLVLLVLILVGGIGVAYIFLKPLISKMAQGSSQAGAVQSLRKYGAGITDNQLQHLDSTAAFFGVFANASQQTSTLITSDLSWSGSANDYSGAGTSMRQVGFNYQTKQFSYARADYDQGAQQPSNMNMCVGAQEYAYLSDYADMGWTKSGSSPECIDLTALSLSGLGDGLNTGGLTKAQAAAFVDNLRSQNGLVTVSGARIVQQNNKKLVRFDVTLNHLKSPNGDGTSSYLGTQFFIWAFKATGINPSTWPYTTIGAGADGVHMAYYVDPTTALPVYSQLRTTGALNDQGNPTSDRSFDFEHVEYKFGSQVPILSTNTFNGITFSWPIDKSV